MTSRGDLGDLYHAGVTPAFFVGKECRGGKGDFRAYTNSAKICWGFVRQNAHFF